MIRFGWLLWLVNLCKLFNAILLKEPWWDKGVHAFLKGICPKVNLIAQLEYELAHYDSAVHRLNHYTTLRYLEFTKLDWWCNG